MSTEGAHILDGLRRDPGTAAAVAPGQISSTSAMGPTVITYAPAVPAHRKVVVLLAGAAAVLLLASSAALTPVTSVLVVASVPAVHHSSFAARPMGDETSPGIRMPTVHAALQLRGVYEGLRHPTETRSADASGSWWDSSATKAVGLDSHRAHTRTAAAHDATAPFNHGPSTMSSDAITVPKPPDAGPDANVNTHPTATPSARVLPADQNVISGSCVPLVAVVTFTSKSLASSAAMLLPLLELAEQCNRVSVIVYMDSRLSVGAALSNATLVPAHVRDVMSHYPTAKMAHMHARYMNLYDIPPVKQQLSTQRGAPESASADALRTFMSAGVIRRIVGVPLPHCSPPGHDNATFLDSTSSMSGITMHRKHLARLVARPLPDAVTVVPFIFPDHALDSSTVARETAITIATLHATVHISNHRCWTPPMNVGSGSTTRLNKRARQHAVIPVAAPAPATASGLTIAGIASSTVSKPSHNLLQALSTQSPTLSTRGFVMFGAPLGAQRASVNDLAPVDWRLRLNMDINKSPYQRVHDLHALELLALAAPLATEGLVSGLMALFCAASQHCLWPAEHVRAPHAVDARLTTLLRVSALAYSNHAIRTVHETMTLMVRASARDPPVDLQLTPAAFEPSTEPTAHDIDHAKAVSTIFSDDAAASVAIESANSSPYALPYSRLQYGKKRFVYLIQGESWATSNETLKVHAGLPGSDVILLCWGKPCHDAAAPNVYTIFAPHSSWNEGRNRLMWAAIELERTVNDGPYEFFAFMDEDVRLHCGAGKGVPCAQELQTILDKYKAPITSARWWPICDVEPGHEVSYADIFDAIYNVFHRLALGSFLPYHEDFDHISWYVSQAILFYQAVCIRGLVVQTNSVWVTNGMHRDYPKGATCKPKLADNSVAPASLHKYINWPCIGCVLKGYRPRKSLLDTDPATLAPGWATQICNATMLGDGLYAKSVAVPARVRRGLNLKGRKTKEAAPA